MALLICGWHLGRKESNSFGLQLGSKLVIPANAAADVLVISPRPSYRLVGR